MFAGGYGDGEHLPQSSERVNILSHNWFLYPVWLVLFHPCEHFYRIVQVPPLESVEIDSVMLPEGFADGLFDYTGMLQNFPFRSQRQISIELSPSMKSPA